MILDLLQQLSTLLLFFFELDAQHTLLDEFVKVLLRKVTNIVLLVGVLLFLILLFKCLFDLLLVEDGIGIGCHDPRKELYLSGGGLSTERHCWLL